MAYAVRYTSEFYNRFNQKYKIELSQDAYAGSPSVITLAGVNTSYRQNERFIVGQVDIYIVNTGDFNQFDDLLNNNIREWQCVLYKDSDIYFQGWIVVDVVEQQFMNNSTIKITFSDELIKLQDIEVETATFGSILKYYDIIKAAFAAIHDKSIYVNSSLFYYTHTKTSTYTLFEQSYLDTDYVYENNVEKLSYWEVVNDILKMVNCYAYAYRNAYYIERYNDINRTANWVSISTAGTFSSVANAKQTYNKQDDFEYIDLSQYLSYNAGLSELKLDLNPEEFLSILPNRWDLPLSEITYTTLGDPYYTDYPNLTEATLSARTYYTDEYATEVTTGSNDYGMDNYISLNSTHEYALYYPWYFPIVYMTRISFSEGNSTRLQLKWKIRLWNTYNEETKYFVGFALRKGSGGTKADNWITEIQDGAEYKTFTALETSLGQPLWSVSVSETDYGSRLVEFSKVIELNNLKADSADSENIIIYIIPTLTERKGVYSWVTQHHIGDFEVKVLDENKPNQDVYTINEGFVKSESDELKIFDIDSYNYKNGIYLSDRSKTTEGWTDDGGLSYMPVVDHYVKNIVGYGYKTRKQLRSDIIFNSDTYIKPLSIMNDDNVSNDFLVKEIDYDFINSVYRLSLDEYSTDKGEIIINE